MKPDIAAINKEFRRLKAGGLNDSEAWTAAAFNEGARAKARELLDELEKSRRNPFLFIKIRMLLESFLQSAG